MSKKLNFKDKRPKLFIDMDGVVADFEGKTMNMSLQHLKRPKTHKLYHEEGFYRDLKPVPGAVEAIKKLDEVYNVYLLSTPSWHNPSSWTDKRLWAEEVFGDIFFKKVILSHDKGLFSGYALIDDRDVNNQGEFDGLNIVFGSEEYPTWDEVLEFLL